MSLVWFILIIGLSIFIHELGHYLAARLQGVRVKAFSVGFGPVLFRKPLWGTEWRIAAIPLGGYADIEGLIPEEKGLGYDRLTLLGKLLVLVSGVFMNLLLALFLLAYLFHAQGVPEATGRAVVLEVAQGSPAEAIGLKPGDVIVAVDGKPLERAEGINRLKTPGAHTLTLLREGRELVLPLVWKPGSTRLGVVYQPEVIYRKIGFAEALGLSASRALAFLPQMVKALVGGLFSTLSG
ncbi:MAG: peptidase, partial [Thermus sp.]